MSQMDENIALLLGEYPVIWNRRLNDFKDVGKKEKAFKEMAQKLNSTVQYISSRYKALREKYRKEKLKLNLVSSGAGQSQVEPWHLMETLSFLDGVQAKRRTTTNCPPARPIEEVDVDSMFGPSTPDMVVLDATIEAVDETETIGGFPSSSLDEPTPQPAKRQKRTAADIETMLGQLVSAADRAATTGPSNQAHSEYQTFGRFVGQSLLKMDEDSASDAMLEIQQILHKYRRWNI